MHFNLDKTVKVVSADKEDNAPATLEGVKVLLVEDVKFNVIVAKKMMENWKIIIDLAENGQVAVEKIKNNKYRKLGTVDVKDDTRSSRRGRTCRCLCGDVELLVGW